MLWYTLDSRLIAMNDLDIPVQPTSHNTAYLTSPESQVFTHEPMLMVPHSNGGSMADDSDSDIDALLVCLLYYIIVYTYIYYNFSFLILLFFHFKI